MASALTIDISATRAITATGRLVAGETASISIVGASPAKLYLINADRVVVAYADSFTPASEGVGGAGNIDLATDKIATIVADIAAGRAFSLAALVEDANGAIVGAGFVPVVSAPMPEQLTPINIDPYVKLSDLAAYLTKAEAAETYATKREIPSALVETVNGVPPIDGAIILTGADFPATASAPEGANNLAAQVDFNTQTAIAAALGLANKQDVLSSTQLANIAAVPNKADAADLRYALGEAITATAQLADRTVNRVAPLATNTADIVLTFPAAISAKARDFLVLVTNTTGNTGSITFVPPTVSTIYGDGFSTAVPSGETWLYSVTEVAANTFWAKSEKMEVAQ